MRGKVRQPDPFQRSHCTLFFLVIEQRKTAAPAWHAPQTTEQDVVQHAEAIDQIELLEDITDIGAQTSHLAVEAAGGLNLAPKHLNLTTIAAIAARQAGEMPKQR